MSSEVTANSEPDLERRAVVKELVIGLAALTIGGCAALTPKPDFYPTKEAPNTVTYIDKSGKEATQYNLSGEWEANYPYGREVVRVTQKGNYFEGTKMIGSRAVGKGEKTIRGEVDGDVVSCDVYHAERGWRGTSLKISQNGNTFECYSLDGLIRFTRIKK